MEMATTTTTTTNDHGDSIIEESSITDCSSGGGGELRRQLHCTTESPLSTHSHNDHDVLMDTTYNSTAPPLRTHTSSIDNMLDASLMTMIVNHLREEDADILEQGVEEKHMHDLVDFDEDGRRLDMSSSHHHHRLSSASLTDLVESGCLSLEDSFDRHYQPPLLLHDSTATNRSDGNNNNDIILPDSISGTSPNIRRSNHESNDSSIMPVIAEDSSIIIPQDDDPHADTTFTEQPRQLHSDDNNTTDDDYFLGASSPETQPKPKLTTTNDNDDEIDLEALTLRITSGRAHNRSVSFDRRMIESAQFAEAVGEDPSGLLLQKIIEQDSSSDFDDDDIDEGGVDVLGEEEEEFLLEELQQDYDANQEASSAINEAVVGSTSDDDVVVVVAEDDAVVNAASLVLSASLAPLSSAAEGTDNNNNNNVEPKCVSTDLSRVSPKESEEVVVCNSNNNNNNDDSQQLVLPTISNNSAPPTPIPSPAKARISPFTSFHPPCVDWKFQRQHSSSASLDGGNRFHPTTTTTTVAAQTNTNNDAADFRGIRLPEITKRGVARGNYAQLHRKAWLEVSDKHHRYGKNLRMYYKHWESLGHPYHMFFDWLDAKGEAQGTELPNLPELPRSVLDSDTVQYITDPGISASYALDIVADPTDGSAFVIDRRSQTPICTGKEGWIFVLRDHVFYGSQKVIAPNKVVETPVNITNADSAAAAAAAATPTPTPKPRQRFHHSSFFGGKAVASAGIFLTDDQGHLTHLYPHSGHYRPGEAHVQRVLFFMQQLGVELSTFVVDMQQLFKVSRKFAPKGGMGNDNAVVDKENTGKQQTVPQQMKKAKKTDCLHLMCGLETACFLAHKALMIERGVFHQIHKIRRILPDQRSVRNILNHVN